MTVQEMRKAGYPLKIIGNGGYKATLVSCQPLAHGEYMGIYRYPGGDCCHDLAEIKRYFETPEIAPISVESEFSLDGSIEVDGREEKFRFRGVFDRIEG